MKAKKQYRYDPDYAVPPGATLQETMESLGMSQKETGHAHRPHRAIAQPHLQG